MFSWLSYPVMSTLRINSTIVSVGNHPVVPVAWGKAMAPIGTPIGTKVHSYAPCLSEKSAPFREILHSGSSAPESTTETVSGGAVEEPHPGEGTSRILSIFRGKKNRSSSRSYFVLTERGIIAKRKVASRFMSLHAKRPLTETPSLVLPTRQPCRGYTTQDEKE
jgi:hypothetical protein